ncbi:Hypothetical predicted protein [Cloeon dipterum]|uniref:BTB domain-containing protein n=1 Tax=Cloeon dipterum TaxID=197152 RepID=A0A8S1CD69_9INSE|nr:Hypothetical predicted protein [Cloeon dipterum]
MNTMEDDSEQFSLRWNNFHTNMSSGFQELLEDKSLVDVTLACEGQYIQAHRAVLTVCSPYFKALFKVNPNNHPIIILKDVSFIDLKSILQFMYRGEVNVKQDDLNTFLKTAEVLKVKGLTGDDNKESTRNVSQLFQESQSPQMKRRKIVEAAKPSPPPPLPQPKEDSQPKIQFITIKPQNEEENEAYIDDDDDDNEQDFSAQDESLDLESQICLDSGGPMGMGMRSALDIEGSSSHSSMQGHLIYTFLFVDTNFSKLFFCLKPQIDKIFQIQSNLDKIYLQIVTANEISYFIHDFKRFSLHLLLFPKELV